MPRTRSGSPISRTSASSSCRRSPGPRPRSSPSSPAAARSRPGRRGAHDGVWWCPMTPGRVLAVYPPERTAGVRDAPRGRRRRHAGFAIGHRADRAFGSNAVAGPLARETFARTTALDLRPDRSPRRPSPPSRWRGRQGWSCGATATGSSTSSGRATPSTSGRCLSTRPSTSAGARSARLPAPERRGAPVRDLFRKRRMWRRRRAQGPLRRRHHRRRLARARDRLLPGARPRDHRRLRARAELHRLRRGGAQHDDPALQLQDARGRALLRRLA